MAGVRPLAAQTAADPQPWVRNVSVPFQPTEGLAGRHICVWASHGSYYKQKKTALAPGDTLVSGAWEWQRPRLYCTTEDLLTPSIVYPFLVPMLENAGAVVWTPRERDMQRGQALVDTVTRETAKAYVWQAAVPAAGEYAVYVRYPYLADAVPDAVYTIHHGGERTRVAVNQRMGAGTWVYLGTYRFNPALPFDGCVQMAKGTRYRGRLALGNVRIGGGMGHISRRPYNAPLPAEGPDTLARASGLPHYLEAARYWTEWAGLPDTLCNTERGCDDYKDDLRSRGNMLNYLMEERDVPFDMSVAVHTDAGYRTDSLVYGTLAICTTASDTTLRQQQIDEASLRLCRRLLSSFRTDLSDLRWQDRSLRDGNYAETRIPRVPAAIVEMLSHQNFLDARYAHDPVFKYRIARSIYKSVLRSLVPDSLAPYVAVQPLPVRKFSALVSGDCARLSWQATPDTLEPTAAPTHYIIYTRTEDGDFDNGQLTTDTCFSQRLIPGLRYTFRVVAANAGGLSFPSHQLSVYKSPIADPSAPTRRVLFVDAFTRLSGPAYIDTPDSLGFLLDTDAGVPWGRTLEYCGAQRVFDRSRIGNESETGLGYSGHEREGVELVGNGFDISVVRTAAFVMEHAEADISSACADALPSPLAPYDALYWLAGKQRRVPHNMADYPVWPEAVRPAVAHYLQCGGELHVEGDYVSPCDLSPDEREWWLSLEK